MDVHVSLLSHHDVCLPKHRLTVFGASAQQVHNVEVRTQVTHDFQLRHEGLSLAPPGRGCRERENESDKRQQDALCPNQTVQ